MAQLSHETRPGERTGTSTKKSSLEPVRIAQIVVAPTIADSPRSGRNSLAQRATLGSGTHNLEPRRGGSLKPHSVRAVTDREAHPQYP